MLTFGEIKRSIAQYAGSGGACPDDDVNLFVKKVLQFLLYSGTNQDLKRYDFVACKGVFTVPEEVESIQKIRINGQVGNVWDKWFSFHASNWIDSLDCICPPDSAVYEDPNYYATVYDVPAPGSKIGILGHCDESPYAHAIIQGKDASGRQIFTDHKGKQINGEYLSICKGTLKYTEVTFASIDNVILTKTNGYKTLYAVDPSCGNKFFLSDYTPLEEHPTYRRYRLTDPSCCPFARVSILARMRLKDNYSDLDKVPFENLYAIQMAAQTVNSSTNTDLQSAAAQLQFMDTIINREQAHKKVQTGIPINISPVTGPGRVRNIVGGFFGGLWGGIGGGYRR